MRKSDLMTIKRGTKVLVHGKTTGCPFSNVASRKAERYPREFPFFAYIKGIENLASQIYTLSYRPLGSGGDYYNRRDFEIVNEDMFTDKDFEL